MKPEDIKIEEYQDGNKTRYRAKIPRAKNMLDKIITYTAERKESIEGRIKLNLSRDLNPELFK